MARQVGLAVFFLAILRSARLSAPSWSIRRHGDA